MTCLGVDGQLQAYAYNQNWQIIYIWPSASKPQAPASEGLSYHAVTVGLHSCTSFFESMCGTTQCEIIADDGGTGDKFSALLMMAL